MIDLSLGEPIIDFVSLYFRSSGKGSVSPRLLQLACSASHAGSDESVLVLENHQRFGENCLEGETPRVRINSCPVLWCSLYISITICFRAFSEKYCDDWNVVWQNKIGGSYCKGLPCISSCVLNIVVNDPFSFPGLLSYYMRTLPNACEERNGHLPYLLWYLVMWWLNLLGTNLNGMIGSILPLKIYIAL